MISCSCSAKPISKSLEGRRAEGRKAQQWGFRSSESKPQSSSPPPHYQVGWCFPLVFLQLSSVFSISQLHPKQSGLLFFPQMHVEINDSSPHCARNHSEYLTNTSSWILPAPCEVCAILSHSLDEVTKAPSPSVICPSSQGWSLISPACALNFGLFLPLKLCVCCFIILSNK